MKTVYLDYTATTPVAPEVLEAMNPYFVERFGNPSSIHSFGEDPLEAIGEAREKVARLIGAAPQEIIFTSCGTEANNHAIKGVAFQHLEKKGHIIVSAIEHFSVWYVVRRLQKWGYRVTYLPVDRDGMVDPDDVAGALSDDTILVSIQLASNEVGTIQPLKEIARIVKEKKIPFHTDAVAAVGIIPVDVKELGVDFLALAANQFYGPKGAGALYVRHKTPVVPLMDGGAQEDGKRSGTENVPAIVGMGRAAELAMERMESDAARYRSLRLRLIEGLTERIDQIYINGHPEKCLPNIVNLSAGYVEGESMLLFLDGEGIAVASGSACTSVSLKASHILTAMQVSPELAQGSLLFSFGRETTEEDIDYVIEKMPPIVKRLRELSPLYEKHARMETKIAAAKE
ncbi:MAG: cysteine desulfurase [Deltaproteobacteria bacterium]|nr:cysteine desulfurase [Deltaproteobacteria bacterium]MBW2306438.1 cysteine desulfurase [Deltaproteobacteria bacterium]